MAASNPELPAVREDLLQYAWQHQQISRPLQTVCGQAIRIFHPGYPNTGSGPDFGMARLNIGGITWAGQVEVHIRASDWERHGHQTNPAYDNVVLHVVWEYDTDIRRPDGSVIPTLVLSERLPEALLHRYQQIKGQIRDIKCAALWSGVRRIDLSAMLDRCLAERLHRKAEEIIQIQGPTQDWEQAAYAWLMRGFGFKVNAPAFAALADALPFRLLRKHADQPHQVEALLFGQAGWLAKATDDYQQKLQQEYRFLAQKYGLQPMNPVHWKLARMRPANFPTVRLAQLSALLAVQPNLFSAIVHTESPGELMTQLRPEVSAYWQQHYAFGKPWEKAQKRMGTDSAQNLVINTLAPMLFAYGVSRQLPELQDRAVNWLMDIPAERNAILRQWRELGLKPAHAFESQALLELHRHYCLEARCLSCAIGCKLLRS